MNMKKNIKIDKEEKIIQFVSNDLKGKVTEFNKENNEKFLLSIEHKILYGIKSNIIEQCFNEEDAVHILALLKKVGVKVNYLKRDDSYGCDLDQHYHTYYFKYIYGLDLDITFEEEGVIELEFTNRKGEIGYIHSKKQIELFPFLKEEFKKGLRYFIKNDKIYYN